MYVAQLDRSWLDTPFLFQGFQVHEKKEIELLQQYCRHVYVEVERSSLEKSQILEARRADRSVDFLTTRDQSRHIAPRTETLSQRILRAISHLDSTGKILDRLNRPKEYKNVVTTAKEAPRAIDAYSAATKGIQSVFTDLRNGGVISIDRVQRAVEPMVDSVMRNQDAMAWLVYLRKQDEYSYNHAVASSVWAVIMGRHLGFDTDSLNTLAIGGILLDVGKSRIPESITNSRNPLTVQEMAVMETHVEHGVEIARSMPGIKEESIMMIECHHERHDGSGYPKGLSGNDIPVYGRIAGVVDCYDAMISNRPHEAAKSTYEAIRRLNFMIGTKFQIQLIEQFVQALGMFPTGSIVEINTGEVGIVIEQNRVRRLRPKVMLVLNSDKNAYSSGKTLDLQRVPSDEGQQGARWIMVGHEPGSFGIDAADFFL